MRAPHPYLEYAEASLRLGLLLNGYTLRRGPLDSLAHWVATKPHAPTFALHLEALESVDEGPRVHAQRVWLHAHRVMPLYHIDVDVHREVLRMPAILAHKFERYRLALAVRTA